MAGRSENNKVTFTRCIKCPTAVVSTGDPTRRLVHLENGEHEWQDWSPAAEAPRPDHRTVSIWNDVRAAVEHIRLAEFLLGFHPEKPTAIDWEGVQLQLSDARAVLTDLANALTEGATS